jgi:hypothetical protein
MLLYLLNISQSEGERSIPSPGKTTSRFPVIELVSGGQRLGSTLAIEEH